MSEGTNAPLSRKSLAILAAAALVLVVGLAVVTGSFRDGQSTQQVTKKEAEIAKKKGAELFRQGKWDGALEELKKAVAGNPEDIQAHFRLAFAYEQKGQLDEAYEQYQAILKIDGNSADAHYSIGRILMQKQEFDVAVAQFETAVKLNSNFTGARAALAEAYTQKKDYEKALAAYDELEKLVKTDNLYLSRIHSAKGGIYKNLGQESNARAEFATALRLDKNNQEAAAGIK